MTEQKSEETSGSRSQNVIRFPTKVNTTVITSQVEEKKEPEWVQEVTRKLQAARLARTAKQTEAVRQPLEPIKHGNAEEIRKKVVASFSLIPGEGASGAIKSREEQATNSPHEIESPPVTPVPPALMSPILITQQKSVVQQIPVAQAPSMEPDLDGVVLLNLDEVLHLQENDSSPAVPKRTFLTDRSILLSRILAGLVDFIMVLICSTPFLFTLNYLSTYEEINRFTLAMLAGIAILIYHLYSLFFLCFSGQTIGMMIAELQVVNLEGDLPNHQQAIGRTFFFLLSCLCIGLGLFWSLLDKKCRCLQDILSATEIIRVRETVSF